MLLARVVTAAKSCADVDANSALIFPNLVHNHSRVALDL